MFRCSVSQSSRTVPINSAAMACCSRLVASVQPPPRPSPAVKTVAEYRFLGRARRGSHGWIVIRSGLGRRVGAEPAPLHSYQFPHLCIEPWWVVAGGREDDQQQTGAAAHLRPVLPVRAGSHRASFCHSHHYLPHPCTAPRTLLGVAPPTAAPPPSWPGSAVRSSPARRAIVRPESLPKAGGWRQQQLERARLGWESCSAGCHRRPGRTCAPHQSCNSHTQLAGNPHTSHTASQCTVFQCRMGGPVHAGFVSQPW